jgi:hypothetical protein
MSQSKKGSALEAVTNVVVGYSVNYTANLLLFPLFGWHITTSQNITLGVIYTAISLCRSYALRRFYNWRTIRAVAARQAGTAGMKEQP